MDIHSWVMGENENSEKLMDLPFGIRVLIYEPDKSDKVGKSRIFRVVIAEIFNFLLHPSA